MPTTQPSNRPRSFRLFICALQALVFCGCTIGCHRPDLTVAENQHFASDILHELNSLDRHAVDVLECPERHPNLHSTGEINGKIHDCKERLKVRGYLAAWDSEWRTYHLEPDPIAIPAKELLQKLNTLPKDPVDVIECPERHASEPVDAQIADLADQYKAELKTFDYFVAWDRAHQLYEFGKRSRYMPRQARDCLFKLNTLDKAAVDIVEHPEQQAGEHANREIARQVRTIKDELRKVGYRAIWEQRDQNYRLQQVDTLPIANEILQKLNGLDKDAVDIVECPTLHFGEEIEFEIVELIDLYKKELEVIEWHAIWDHKNRKYWFHDPRTGAMFSIP